MSQSDPNNPYAAPQGGQYPSYPQGGGQPPQGQPGHPAPNQPYGQPYPGGNAMPPQMPGMLKAARVLLFVFGGLGIVGGFFTAIGGSALSNADVQEAFEDQGLAVDESMAGILIAVGVVGLLVSVAQIVIAAKFGKGGPGVRIAGIVSAVVMAAVGIFYFPLGIVWIIVGILIVVFLAVKDSAAWFAGPRH
ncbi:hypothetical protein [Streptomyces sp. Ru87]|uniref:hypothetical protein n=1 Tax=Streptomyces sp. Ru87 TaxID=2044307 RepID=UPI000BF8230A|nr:hypothetical protein [Streptomyces sp. Ru87]PGH48615.1 hypothetical protein CRI70_22180 [Streptomyces sp. Ru87]